MSYYFNLRPKEIAGFITISIAIATTLSFIHSEMYLAIILILFVSVGLIFFERIMLGLIIVSYLSSLTDFVGELRIILNFIFTSILLLLFIREYGLKFSNYPKLPALLKLFFIFLFITLFLSTLFSEYKFLGFYSIITSSLFFLICYMIYGLIKSRKEVYIIIASIAISVFIISVRMLLDIINLGVEGFFGKIAFQGEIEMFGSAGYTGYAIFFISFSLISSVFLINKFPDKKIKWSYFLFLSTTVFALIFSNSRALLVAAFLSLVFMLYILNRPLLLKTSILAIFLVLVLLSIPEIYNVVELYFRLDTVNQRDYIWQTGYDIIKDNIIFGVGPRAFPNYFFSYAPSQIFDFFHLPIWKYGIPHPHNLFLYYWSENGILGLFAVILFFSIYFYISIKTLSRTRRVNKEYYILSLNAVGIGIGMLFRSFFEIGGLITYGYITFDLPFWLNFLILIRIPELTKEDINLN